MIIGVNGKARAGQQGNAPTDAPDPENLRNGTVWFGDKGWVYVSRGKLEASNKEWLKEIREREQKGTLEVPLYKSPGVPDHQEPPLNWGYPGDPGHPPLRP